jgi:triacylglycerol esterase/lipase EstA (alpha/beta hydrolase family)
MRLDRTALALSLAVFSFGCSAAMEGQAGEREQSVGPAGEADESGESGEAGAAEAVGRTPHPIVLLHGAAGFDRIGPLDYYFRVAGDLVDAGHDVFTTEVSPLQTIEVRAGQLAEQIDAILDQTGAGRVHLIAHSQGGLDARFLISSLGYGDRVATLTTISTPHRGSRVADIALGIIPGPVEDTLGFLIDLLVGAIDGSEQDVVDQLYQLTEEYQVNTFDQANPDDPQVEYYSVAGVTQLNPFANPFKNDLCDPLLVAGHVLLRGAGANDGLVSVDSATRGVLLGTMPADHLDEVGQLFGTTALGFDHREFYVDLAAFVTDPAAPSPL